MNIRAHVIINLKWGIPLWIFSSWLQRRNSMANAICQETVSCTLEWDEKVQTSYKTCMSPVVNSCAQEYVYVYSSASPLSPVPVIADHRGASRLGVDHKWPQVTTVVSVGFRVTTEWSQYYKGGYLHIIYLYVSMYCMYSTFWVSTYVNTCVRRTISPILYKPT